MYLCSGPLCFSPDNVFVVLHTTPTCTSTVSKVRRDVLGRQALQPQCPFGFSWAQERVRLTEGRSHLSLFSQMSHPQISSSLKIKLLCTMLQSEKMLFRIL